MTGTASAYSLYLYPPPPQKKKKVQGGLGAKS